MVDSDVLNSPLPQPVQAGSGAVSLYPATGTADAIPVYYGAGAVPTNDGQIVISGATITINPSKTLVSSGVLYNVLIPATAVTDADGNAFAGYTTGGYTFRVIDTEAPFVESFNPTNGATGFPSTGNLTLTFNEPVQRGAGNIVLTPSYGAALTQPTPITIAATDTAAIIVEGATLRINPSIELAVIGVNYTMSLDQGAVLDASKSYLGTVIHTVTVVNGSNGTYFVDGVQPTSAGLTLLNRNTYVFNLDDASNAASSELGRGGFSQAAGFPLRVSESWDGTHGSGVAYETGVVYTPGNASEGYHC